MPPQVHGTSFVVSTQLNFCHDPSFCQSRRENDRKTFAPRTAFILKVWPPDQVRQQPLLGSSGAGGLRSSHRSAWAAFVESYHFASLKRMLFPAVPKIGQLRPLAHEFSQGNSYVHTGMAACPVPTRRPPGHLFRPLRVRPQHPPVPDLVL